MGYAERAPSNESPWNYAKAFFRAGGRSYSDFPEVKDRALALQVRRDFAVLEAIFFYGNAVAVLQLCRNLTHKHARATYQKFAVEN